MIYKYKVFLNQRCGESRWSGLCGDCFLDPLSPLQLLSPWLFSVFKSHQGYLEQKKFFDIAKDNFQ